MIRDKINSILKSKSFYVIFSIVASVALWTYVSYSENPDVNVPVTGIPIQLENEEILTQNKLIVTNVQETSLTVNFHGKRNDVTHLSRNNLVASVNLGDVIQTGIGVPGVYELSYDIIYPDDVKGENINISSASTSYVTVTVESLAEKTLTFVGNYDGKVADGYQAEPMEFTPQEITVSGPAPIVAKIDHAFVNITRDGLSRSLTEEMDYVLRDADNNIIDKNMLTFSSEKVLVRLPISVVKEVELVVNFIEGNSAALNSNVKYTIDPQKITLSGEADILADVSQLVLTTIDLNSFAKSMTETFEIPLPTGVINLTGETEATVTVKISGVETAEARATNIQLKNETVGHKTDIITKHLDVILRGSKSDLKKVKESNIRVVADLGELGNTTGTFSVAAKVFVDGFPNVDAVGNYTITVVVSN